MAVCRDKFQLQIDFMAGKSITIMLNGTTDLPPGKIAAVVTSLEMWARPFPQPDPPGCEELVLERIDPCDVDRYLSIYRVLGERWMWFSRLVIPRAEVAAILAQDGVEAYVVRKDGQDAGLLELDWRIPGECELAFLGIDEPLIGTGVGRWVMNQAIAMAWTKPISRFWVHTCSFDHPSASQFYQRSGFVPFKTGIEVADDPRKRGHLPVTAVAHIPII
jgi:GNAT superfamily N-acetyltransferase